MRIKKIYKTDMQNNILEGEVISSAILEKEKKKKKKHKREESVEGFVKFRRNRV